MKKLLLLLTVFAFAFTSCNSDDDANTAQDPFIGTWKFYKFIDNGVEEEVEPCETNTTLVVAADGTFTTTDYDADFNGDCIVEGVISGTWENRGNSVYRLTTAGSSQDEKVVFENNTFILTDTYTEEGVDYVDKTIFIRS